eukprot:Skav228147  [mRNA]  locus=scaffold2683:91733:100173:+ [translate_table: standard]
MHLLHPGQRRRRREEKKGEERSRAEQRRGEEREGEERRGEARRGEERRSEKETRGRGEKKRGEKKRAEVKTRGEERKERTGEDKKGEERREEERTRKERRGEVRCVCQFFGIVKSHHCTSVTCFWFLKWVVATWKWPSALSQESKFLEEAGALPKTYQVLHHTQVCNFEGQPLPEVRLDPGDQVHVLEMKCCDGNIGSVDTQILNRLAQGTKMFSKFHAVWGRIEAPKGWIVLYDGASKRETVHVPTTAYRVPYRANRLLKIPFPTLFGRQLLLAASHASLQWMILDQMAPFLKIETYLVLGFACLAMNIFVLRQTELVSKWGLRHDQLLETDRERLRPVMGHRWRIFAGCILVIFALMCYACSPEMPLRLYFVLMAAIALHAWVLHLSMKGLSKWKEPEVASEFTQHEGEKLPSRADDNRLVEYTFLVVRTGESRKLSLKGNVSREQEPRSVDFSETRRWAYQKKNTEWNIPNLSDASLEVEVLPVCFAPIVKQTDFPEASTLTYYSHTGCSNSCGEEEAGFGNDCSTEQEIELLDGASTCIFTKNLKTKVQVSSNRSLFTGEPLSEFLCNVTESGQFAMLRVANLSRSKGQVNKVALDYPDPTDKPLSLTTNDTEFGVWNTFSMSMPGDQLSQIMELVIGTTKGETDSQEDIADASVPLTVLKNPPPVVINVSGINQGFLIPNFTINTLAEYVACNISNLQELDSINGFVFDGRFRVDETVSRSKHDCMGFQRNLKQFTVIRSNESECGLYCGEYLPRHVYFDLAVSSSASQIDAIKAAIKVNDNMVLSNFIRTMPKEYWEKAANSDCDVVQEAVILDRFDMIKLFAESEPTNETVLPCNGCKSTPLGVAAREHKNEAVEQLLNLGVPVDVMDRQDRLVPGKPACKHQSHRAAD